MTSNQPNVYLVIVSAGTGSRLGGDIPKQYIELMGQSILGRTLDAFVHMKRFKSICVVTNPAHDALAQKTLGAYCSDLVFSCAGGTTRRDSVYKGLCAFSDVKNDDIVLIHDAARPFVSSAHIENLIHILSTSKAATLAVPVVDTLRYSNAANIAKNGMSRNDLWALQTPQGFRYGVIKNAHENAVDGQNYTDDTSLITDHDVTFVQGHKNNFKITTREDLDLAKLLVAPQHMEARIGSGFDVHAFDEVSAGVTSVRLCGVDIEYDRKLQGHSDADVGLHALTDAILGAIGEGDIGLHFPPSNMDFKDMDSAIFLERAMDLLREKNGRLVNIDVTLICERPKVGPYRSQIVARLADILKIDQSRVNIKATTTERLGFTGRKEGIAAQASVCVMIPAPNDESKTC